MGKRNSQQGHDGRFDGASRVNVEDVPRLPTFPAAWTLSDPRGRPYFVFWTSPLDGALTHCLRMESVQQGATVQLTIPDVGVFRIPIVRRPLPSRSGFAILYPGCGQPRRHLYLRSLVIGRFVDYQGPLCQACAGLRWLLKADTSGSSIVRFGLGWGCRPPIGFLFRVIPGIPGRSLIRG